MYQHHHQQTTTSNDTKHDDQQAASLDENHTVSSESSSATNDVEIVITGYEAKALACRDEMLKVVKDFESTITDGN